MVIHEFSQNNIEIVVENLVELEKGFNDGTQVHFHYAINHVKDGRDHVMVIVTNDAAAAAAGFCITFARSSVFRFCGFFVSFCRHCSVRVVTTSFSLFFSP